MLLKVALLVVSALVVVPSALEKKDGNAAAATASADQVKIEDSDRPVVRMVVSTGVGLNPDQALKNALFSAVEQVVGLLVDGTTLIKQNDTIEETIRVGANGFIKHYDKLKEWKAEDLYKCRISAQVEDRKLSRNLEAAGVVVMKVDGKDLAARIMTDNAAAEATSQILGESLRRLPQQVLEVSKGGDPVPIRAGAEGMTRLRIPVTIRVNEDAYSQAVGQLVSKLDKMARSKEQFVFKMPKMPKMDSKAPYRTSSGHTDNACILQSAMQQGMDSSGLWPPPTVFAAQKWFCAEYWEITQSVRRAQEESWSRCASRGESQGIALAYVSIITSVSGSGVVKGTWYGVDEDAARDIPSTDRKAAIIDVDLIGNDQKVIDSAAVILQLSRSADTYWSDEQHVVFILRKDKAGDCAKRGKATVRVCPGLMNLREYSGDSGSRCLSQSWYGNIYTDVDTSKLKSLQTISLKIRWQAGKTEQ